MSTGAPKLNDGHAKSRPQTATPHNNCTCFVSQCFGTNRPKTTIMGAKAAVMCGMSLLTKAVFRDTSTANDRLAKRQAYCGSDLQAVQTHRPTTYAVARIRTIVCLDGSCHSVPMLLWNP